MKLETTLEERPGFLHAMPVFDLIMLVIMLLLLGPMFLNQSGISVDVPVSRFQMQRYEESITVTLGAGGDVPSIYLGRQPVTKAELREYLAEFKADETMSRALVLLKSDVGVSVGVERELAEMILNSGFKVALVGKARTDSVDVENVKGVSDGER